MNRWKIAMLIAKLYRIHLKLFTKGRIVDDVLPTTDRYIEGRKR